mmetsp:Transcript_163631/g.298556  ORF Transcript_163631/g.298556 Transcript_163631/m.298556 type:complete len:446 (+) Transcript_163631:62-1399(+)
MASGDPRDRRPDSGSPPRDARQPPPGYGYPPPGHGYPPPAHGYPPPGNGYPPPSGYPPPGYPSHSSGPPSYPSGPPPQPSSRDPYSRDPYSRDPYSRDPYGRPPGENAYEVVPYLRGPPRDPYEHPPPGHTPGYGRPYDYGPPPPGYGHPPPGYGHPPPGYGPPPGPYGHPPPGYPPYGAPPPGPYGHPPPPGWPAPHPGWGPPPWDYRGRSRSRSRSGRRGGGGKYTCRFFIGIKNEEEFHVVRRIIGSGGAKMKDIVARSGGDAKLRLRGEGSGFVERDTQEESHEPLQLCISCPREDGYEVARRCAEDLLRGIYEEYDRWCADRGLSDRAPQIRVSEKVHHGEPAGFDGPAKRRGGKNKQSKAGRQNREPPDMDRGTAPAGAPGEEEIERMIQERNDARRKGDYHEADRIRDDLKRRGVVLSDEKGAHGNAHSVTTWRYWND